MSSASLGSVLRVNTVTPRLLIIVIVNNYCILLVLFTVSTEKTKKIFFSSDLDKVFLKIYVFFRFWFVFSVQQFPLDHLLKIKT